MNFSLLDHIKSILPRPILFIIGENAHSRYFTEDAYKLAAEPKELYVVKGARHIDLYDKKELIPFNELESFFRAISSYSFMISNTLQNEKIGH